jgi:addiction module HigA family antidote
MDRKPTTPGEILLEEFLIPLGMTQKDLALHLRCDYKVINRIINGESSVSPDMAIKLGLAFNTTPDFWLNAQMAMDLWEIRSKKPKIRPLIKGYRKVRRSSHGSFSLRETPEKKTL